MILVEKYLPSKYSWDFSKGGLIKNKGDRIILLADSIPVNIEKKTYVNLKKGVSIERVCFRLLSIRKGELYKKYELNISNIDKGIEIKKILENVLVELGMQKEVIEVYKYLLKNACKNLDAKVEYEYEYGWNNKKFYWEVKKELCDEKKVATEICNFLNVKNGGDMVRSLFLASCHSVLAKLFVDAGINFNFITVILGESSVGKTEAMKAICGIRYNNVFSVSSNRKMIKKILEDAYDTTICLDDINKSDSNRVREQLMQILAEVVHSNSDAGKLILDEDSIEKQNLCNRRHIVLSAEYLGGNISTLNRTMIVHANKSLCKKDYDNMIFMKGEGYFLKFMMGLTEYLSKEFYNDEGLETLQNWYVEIHEDAEIIIKEFNSRSKNRIRNIYAMQITIASIVFDYIKSIGIDEELFYKTGTAIKKTVEKSCKDMMVYIDEKERGVIDAKITKALADIIIDIIDRNGKKIVYFEDEYISNRKKLGMCLKKGYFSFNGERMCCELKSKFKLLNVSSKAISKELRNFDLIYLNGIGEGSCRFESKNRYFNVAVNDLIKLIYPSKYKDYKKDIERVFIKDRKKIENLTSIISKEECNKQEDFVW